MRTVYSKKSNKKDESQAIDENIVNLTHAGVSDDEAAENNDVRYTSDVQYSFIIATIFLVDADADEIEDRYRVILDHSDLTYEYLGPSQPKYPKEIEAGRCIARDLGILHKCIKFISSIKLYVLKEAIPVNNLADNKRNYIKANVLLL